MEQLSLELAHRRADTGIERAADRAERASPGWIDQAAEKLRDAMLLLHNTRLAEQATIETLRTWAVMGGLQAPPDARAWGHVTRLAVRLGYLERIPGAYAPAASSNGSPKPLYRKGPNA